MKPDMLTGGGEVYMRANAGFEVGYVDLNIGWKMFCLEWSLNSLAYRNESRRESRGRSWRKLICSIMWGLRKVN